MTGDVIVELEGGVSPPRALEIFDSLPAVSIEEMYGRWAGSEAPTDNPLDGLLGAYGWHGKRFSSADGVAPLVFGHDGELFEVEPAVIPVRLALRFPRLVRHPAVVAVGRLGLPLLKARRPKARLRMVVYRGVATATMIYDSQPINDHFRRLDEDILLGAMDLRGLPEPFFFLLRREITAR
ncbi:DUF4334 domain-containing protein [Corynebacterium marinum]|uniref:GXWXG domain-containing protein n=2 Tax=Corynebacterium marinum TaxID=349751 RepID=A0A0B6TQ44_9CORY|nr:DUF4334 domain-containing protein [Corynebacterium marinum]AJK67725.1 hypothetical protein B840_00425 [Corynebacterium marinum DSM 44953]GGO12702.1 hypothetical protein GCM10010980_05250 [Corynebacterium marinum]